MEIGNDFIPTIWGIRGKLCRLEFGGRWWIGGKTLLRSLSENNPPRKKLV